MTPRPCLHGAVKETSATCQTRTNHSPTLPPAPPMDADAPAMAIASAPTTTASAPATMASAPITIASAPTAPITIASATVTSMPITAIAIAPVTATVIAAVLCSDLGLPGLLAELVRKHQERLRRTIRCLGHSQINHRLLNSARRAVDLVMLHHGRRVLCNFALAVICGRKAGMAEAESCCWFTTGCRLDEVRGRARLLAIDSRTAGNEAILLLDDRLGGDHDVLASPGHILFFATHNQGHLIGPLVPNTHHEGIRRDFRPKRCQRKRQRHRQA
mmetsp:Transcript_8409/g.23432  ORF Transcript_8409/g.23432 Transcript_8409/m.23432 type:complete len:274 (-) Transcript_8409:55-876(-)